MTPKEKANELVYKYKDAPFNCTSCDMPYCDIRCTMLNTREAKQCALIAVDEVISVIDPETNYTAWVFWKQVKQEIEKL